MRRRWAVSRQLWVWLHRWLGLAMTGFLIVVGLTGSLLAFNSELERLCAPQLFATPRPGVPRLDLATLAERAQALVPAARVTAVLMTEDDQASVYFEPGIDAATGLPAALGFTEFFIDPWTGRELGRRMRGELSQGGVNLMPFIYQLHWTLAAGEVGQWLLGIVALVWSLDCLSAFYLTLPRLRAGFWRRWKPAWLIKRGAGGYRLNFDLHRAGGLWCWPLLFVFAWSSVMMNIRPVYEWVTTAVFDYESPMVGFMAMAHPNPTPQLDWHAALARGEQLMQQQGREHGFAVGQPLGLMYFASTGAYLYDVRGSRDLFERAPKGGGTSILFDGNSGALRDLSQPTGEHLGNTVESWLYALHMARVFGLPYRVFVCVLGLLIVMLSVTGVYVWLKKRRARAMVPAPRRQADALGAAR